jgi:hypothetical protein
MPPVGSVVALDVLGSPLRADSVAGKVARRTSEAFVLAFDELLTNCCTA